MQPGEIEFVAPDDGPAPPPPAWEPPPRARLLRLLALVLVVGGGIAWAVTRPHSGGHDPVAAPPAPSSASSTPAPSTATSPDWAGPLIFQPASPSISISVQCGSPMDCQLASGASDAAVEQAVAQYLPQAQLSAITTTVGHEHGSDTVLTERIIEAHEDSVDVLVRVRPYLRPEPAPTEGITPTPPGLGSAFFQFETAAYVVDVQWTGTDATPPPVTALESLADDPRLESLG